MVRCPAAISPAPVWHSVVLRTTLAVAMLENSALVRCFLQYLLPNTWHTCSSRQAEDDSCRFELACARCSADCDAIPSSVTMADSTIPVCVELMEGTKASSSGTTVATLDLQEGYYRTSAESQVVVECYLASACAGGTDPENYCADGYEGPCECRFRSRLPCS